jgi:hypothetical protein
MKFYRFTQAFLALWLIYKFVGVLPEMRSGGGLSESQEA